MLPEQRPKDLRGSVSRPVDRSAEESSEMSSHVDAASDESLRTPSTHMIADTTLLALIDKLVQGNKRSQVYSLVLYPLIVALIAALGGGTISYLYTTRQQAITRRNSLMDEINKSRIPKLGELWERLDEDDLTINELLEENRDVEGQQDGKNLRLHKIVEILKEDRKLVGKNRFWMGDELYKKTDQYLDQTIQICLRSIGDKNPDLTELRRKKDDVRQDIVRIRDLFLEGEWNR